MIATTTQTLSGAWQMFRQREFRIGDPVVFSLSKWSNHPCRRATDIRPETSGEGYRYCVEKYWVVREVRGDSLVLLTRRGKRRIISAQDPNLHAATWWERLIHANDFPHPERLNASSPSKQIAHPHHSA